MLIKYLKTKAVKFHKPRDSGTFRSNTKPSAQICSDGLYDRVVGLPKNTVDIWIVFTVKPLRSKASFTITKPRVSRSMLGYESLISRLKEIRSASLYWGFRELLARHYEMGYRHMHVEYE